MDSRKGQISIGEIFALILFITVLVSAFMFIQSDIVSDKPLESSLKAEAQNVYNRLESEINVIVYKTPLFIESPYDVKNANIAINFTPSGNVDPDSISVTDIDSNPLLSYYDKEDEVLYWYGDISNTSGPSPSNMFYLTYIENQELEPFDHGLSGTSDIPGSGMITTPYLDLYLGTDSIESIDHYTYKKRSSPYKTGILGSMGISFKQDYGPNITDNKSIGPLAEYDNTTLNLVPNSTIFFIESKNPVVFDLEDFKDSYIFSDNNPATNLTIIDFYDGPMADPFGTQDLDNKLGIAIIGDMDSYVADLDADSITVDSERLMVYIHKGDHSGSLELMPSMNTTFDVLKGVTTTVEGVFEEKYVELASKSDDELRKTFKVSDKSLLINLKGSKMNGMITLVQGS